MKKTALLLTAVLTIAYGSLAPLHAYYHEHVNHACPKNKKNPNASCPGHHKPPSDKDGTTTKGGADTIGCGCQSPWDVLMCFAGY